MSKPKYAYDHLGQEMSADQVVAAIAVMLGWGNTPPWHVVERDLREKLYRLKLLSKPAPQVKSTDE